MLYEIHLRTKCTYLRTANGRQLLRLMPADGPDGQRLIAGSVDIRPAPSERSDRYDFFGNHAIEVCFATAQDEVEFVLRARVERVAQPIRFDLSPRLDAMAGDIERIDSLGPLSPHHFLDISDMVRPSVEIADYVRSLVHDDMTVLEAVRTINAALHRDMTYDGDATTVDTPMEEAFAARQGVCQDFSHIMIACLRELGVPAGYVSGFLRTEPPKGKPRLEGADAMHAWVQAWCGLKLGWIEFDPTNDMLAGVDHVAAARGRDYSDVAPVRGFLRTAGGQDIAQAVDVVPVG